MNHAHHYVLQQTQGFGAHGVCKHCGAEREFTGGCVEDGPSIWQEPAYRKRKNIALTPRATRPQPVVVFPTVKRMRPR